MRTDAIGLAVVLFAHGLAWAGTAELDAARADYMEDEGTGRVLAQIDARLLKSERGARLTLSISAVGAFVDPAPGFEGVRGGNRNTTFEMGLILKGNRAAVLSRTVSPVGTEPIAGSVRGTLQAGRWAAVPERQVRADGTVDMAAKTRETLVELRVDGGAMEPGTHVTEVLLDGNPRLRVTYTVADGAGKIASIESIGLPRRYPKRAVPGAKTAEARAGAQ